MVEPVRVDQQDVVVEVADQGRANAVRPFGDEVVQRRPALGPDVHRADGLPVGLADLPGVLDERAELRLGRRRVDGPQARTHVAEQPVELLPAESAP